MSDNPSILDQFLAFLPEGTVFGEFRPCFVYNEPMDWLEFIYEDCCTVTDYQKGTNIAFLRKWDGEKYCGIVGIKICNFSEFAPPEVVEAFKADNRRRLLKKCVECKTNYADPPSNLCPGCEAYKEHTQ